MKAWGKTLSLVLGAVLASVIGISQMSCLTPEGQLALQNFNSALQQATALAEKDKAAVVVLQAELAQYREAFSKVVEDIKAKKVPADSGVALLGQIMGNIASTQARIAETQKLVDENIAASKTIAASIEDMKNKNVPWYFWLLPAGTAVAGVVSMFVPGISPLAQMLQAANGQLMARQEAAGSLSRTLDHVTMAADAALKAARANVVPASSGIEVNLGAAGVRKFSDMAALKAELMHIEQANDELAEKAVYDEIRAKAAANLI